MIAIVHSIYSQSVHTLALNAWSMDNDVGRYCNFICVPLTTMYKFIDNHIYRYTPPLPNSTQFQ